MTLVTAYLASSVFASAYLKGLEVWNIWRFGRLGVRAPEAIRMTWLEFYVLSFGWIVTFPLVVGAWAAHADLLYGSTVRKRARNV